VDEQEDSALPADSRLLSSGIAVVRTRPADALAGRPLQELRRVTAAVPPRP
jgi:hypothetical protein